MWLAMARLPAGPQTVPLFMGDEGPWGGFTPLAAGDARPPQWIPYVEVDDIDEATARVVAHGGKAVKGPTEIPGFGTVLVIDDPTGATMVLWKEPSAG
jgi:predicted enzyme related to lactoylglutathione lyase